MRKPNLSTLKPLSLTKRVIGENNPEYIQSISNLAGLYYSMEAYEKAEPLYLEARAGNNKSAGRGPSGLYPEP